MFIKTNEKQSVIFARVSSREQEETGYSLPAQEKFLRDYCSTHNLPVNKVFCISESASSKSARKQFNEMLSYVSKNKINTIVCEKVDRLTRNQRDAVTIDRWVNEDSNHEVHFVKNTFVLNQESRASDKFVWNIHVSQAQYNIENLSEEVRKGQKEKLAEGWYPSNPVIGYKSAELGKRKIIVPDEKKAQIIVRLLEEYATGTHSVSSICKLSKELGLKSNYGNYLSKSSMHLLLQRPTYYGAFKWKGKLYLGNHEPIISKELFDKVQKHLKRKTPLRYNRYDYLYKGILKCADCGRLITWEQHKGHLYGYCKGCTGKKAVKENQVNIPLLEFLVQAKIKDLTISSAIREGILLYLKNSNVFQENVRETIEAEIARYTKKLSDLYEDKNEGLISIDLYSAKHKEYNDALFDLKLKQKNIPEDSGVDLEKFEQFFDFSQNMNVYYENATDEEKRKLLKFVFEEIAYSKGKLTYKLSKAFSLLYTAVKLTNSSEVQNIDELKNYISEPTELVAIETKKAPYEAIRSSWLSMSV